MKTETAEEVEASFRADLKQLLMKYDHPFQPNNRASIDIDVGDHGWPVRVIVYIPGIYDKGGDAVRDYAEFTLVNTDSFESSDL